MKIALMATPAQNRIERNNGAYTGKDSGGRELADTPAATFHHPQLTIGRSKETVRALEGLVGRVDRPGEGTLRVVYAHFVGERQAYRHAAIAQSLHVRLIEHLFAAPALDPELTL